MDIRHTFFINVKVGIIVSLLCSDFFFFGCQKSTQRYSEITAISNISMDSANVTIYFNPIAFDKISGGVCWSLTPNPTIDSCDYQAKYIEGKGELDFSLTNLHANRTYYVRSFLNLKKGEKLYSEDYQFKTENFPILNCNIAKGFIRSEGTGTTFRIDPSEIEYSAPNERIMVRTDSIQFQINFRIDPVPGVYVIRDLSDPDYLRKVTVHYKQFYGGCDYGRFELGQEIHLKQNGDKYSISFCNLTGTSAYSNCNEPIILTGEIHN